MRPILPLLPLELPLALPTSAARSSPRRPPTLPKALKSTWRTVVVPGTAPRMDADVVGVALLAAEARRRGGIMVRERGFVGAKGKLASALLLDRVRLLEKDVNAIVKTMVRAKQRARAQLALRRHALRARSAKRTSTAPTTTAAAGT
ncbi:unnamed protein product [Agarophyton chilense]